MDVFVTAVSVKLQWYMWMCEIVCKYERESKKFKHV